MISVDNFTTMPAQPTQIGCIVYCIEYDTIREPSLTWTLLFDVH